MLTKYSATVSVSDIQKNLHRLIGQIYKLLPYREEGLDWEKPLHTIQIELSGMNQLFVGYEDFHTILLSLECKLEGLNSPLAKENFDLFRRDIFECISKVKMLQDICQD